MSDNFDPYKEWLGIEPHERPANHYRLLGLDLFNANPDDVRRAAEARMQLLRSYQSGPRGRHTQQLLNEVSAAKLCLLDNNTRITYDAALQGALAVQEVVPQQPPPPRRSRAGASSEAASDEPAEMAEPPVQKSATPPPPPVPNRKSPNQAAGSPALGKTVPAKVTPKSIATAAPPPPPSIKSGGKKKPLTQEAWFIPSVVCGVVAVALFGVLALVLFRPNETTVQKNPEEDKPSEVENQPAPEDEPPEQEDPPAVELSPLVQENSDGSLKFYPREAKLNGPLEIKAITKAEVISGWKDSGENVEWRFKIKTPSIYRVRVEYAATPDDTDARYRATVGDARKSQSARSKGATTFVTDELFLPVTAVGEHNLVFEVEDVSGGTFSLKSIEFVPTNR